MPSLFVVSWLVGEVAVDDDRDRSWRSADGGAKLSAEESDWIPTCVHVCGAGRCVRDALVSHDLVRVITATCICKSVIESARRPTWVMIWKGSSQLNDRLYPGSFFHACVEVAWR